MNYVKEHFDLSQDKDAFQFLFQVYNYITQAHAQNKKLVHTESHVQALKTIVEIQQYPDHRETIDDAHPRLVGHKETKQ